MMPSMRTRKRELRRALARTRTRARAELEKMPAVQRRRNRRRRALFLLLLLLLLILWHCDCEHLTAPSNPPPTAPDAGTSFNSPAPVAVQPKRRPLAGRVPALPRAQYQNDANAPPSWLQEFRLQVAARSPRLASCFNGASRPGAWRWGAAVSPHGGAVSDHTLETVGAGSSVSATQRACLVSVLSAPRYRLPVAADDDPVLPRRVSILIEF